MKPSARQSENKPDLWIEHDRQLFSASSVTIKSTGEVIKLDHNLKAVFTYMIDQYNSYKSAKKAFYEDQRDIAAVCDVSPRTVYAAIKTLEKMGVLIVKGSKKSHAYTLICVSKVAHNLEFNYKTKLNGEPAYDHKKALTQLIISKGKKYERARAAELSGSSPDKSQPVQGTPDHEFDHGAGDVPIDFDDDLPF